MGQKIRAVYEDGVLKPLNRLDIPEHHAVEILILEDDVPVALVGRVAEQGGSYDFLHHPDEDVYTIDDGEAV
jgi:predicted DNA-binding antitoxin AbrB/MazE fold protein